MSDAPKADDIIKELTERVNRLSGQVAALSAVLAAAAETRSLQPKLVGGMARDLAARKIGDPSIWTEPSDIAARYVSLIAEASQARFAPCRVPPERALAEPA